MPCRICTANDVDALADDIARRLWERAPDTLYPVDGWDNAPENWRTIYTAHAKLMIEVAREEHGHDQGHR